VPDYPKPDFLALLRALNDHQVNFIVIGGICAVLHGAPVNTFDLDVVHSRQATNIEHLMAALRALGAYYRTHPEKKLRPQASHLSSPGHQLLMTRFGPLDVLGAVAGGRGYEELLPHSTEMSLGGNVKARILNLETLIEIKEATGGEKDVAVLPLLRRTLREKR
jgi:predicted nucleotidyltransferase